MEHHYNKRHFTFKGFILLNRTFITNLRSIFKTLISKRISGIFKEKLLLTITAVNKCRYCTMVHTRISQKMGMSREDIKKIFVFNFSELEDDELEAIMFAHHYAESGQKPSKQATKELLSSYDKEKARDIFNYIILITYGNLMGNTIESFESRIKGCPPEFGSFFFEFLVYTLGFFFHKLILQLKN